MNVFNTKTSSASSFPATYPRHWGFAWSGTPRLPLEILRIIVGDITYVELRTDASSTAAAALVMVSLVHVFNIVAAETIEIIAK